MKRTVTLEIAGTRFRLVSDADEGHLERLAEIVNERVEKLREKSSGVAPPSHVLALAALGLADDLVTIEQREAHKLELARSAIAAAVERIDRRLDLDASVSTRGEGD